MILIALICAFAVNYWIGLLTVSVLDKKVHGLRAHVDACPYRHGRTLLITIWPMMIYLYFRYYKVVDTPVNKK